MAVFSRSSSPRRLALLAAALVLPVLAGCSSSPKKAPSAAALPPVYVHMNGENMFLESLVAVAPGQPVVFVNEDTGMHMVLGYNPLTGKVNPRFSGTLPGTPGPGHKVSTYRVVFTKSGIYYYYCPIHAELEKAPGGVYVPVKRPTVHGFGIPMAGEIVVTTDKTLLASDPPTTHRKILAGYFGG